MKRQTELDNFNVEFDDLDYEFYNLDEDVDEIIMKYIKSNKKKFYYNGILSKPE